MQQDELDLGELQDAPVTLENDSKPLLIEVMAQAILYIFKHKNGERNEP